MENQDKNIDNVLEEDQAEETKGGENAIIPKSKIILIKKLLQNVKENNEQIIKLLSTFVATEENLRISVGQAIDESSKGLSNSSGAEEKIIEGVFDGENMIGPDGKSYNISANYASKSKLVEGDVLKLSITGNGTFIYKQIGPIERERVSGILKRVGENEFIVTAEGKSWRIINASVTYFKGEEGDEVIILVPKVGESKWAAVENIIKKQ
ncbi:MAG: 50S ribosomal protein L7/L12 [Parcubacteria group bacterium GW2011_GWE2_39_37]|uniref:50S ribosomal protein L7/L12 n=1 Tax=Candidatus Falkowbacteria bacterium GW2011_GWF2_39_8 TaxID=1618642 RepID=A0A0G0PWZ7_9BACT|nr:MAG: 50S ribosomal protein L7/L12 [Parcubacteria group bacterium GW2011_GWE2_39_37]KKR32448.1 MAG: 50S ribosomal protein L7/L12 [Candidatus Falkowbacteria bacterium GW2011_GWF2_39_8]